MIFNILYCLTYANHICSQRIPSCRKRCFVSLWPNNDLTKTPNWLIFGEIFGNQRVHGYMFVFQVYGCVFFTTIVFSPIFGKYIERIGSRNLFLLGTLIAGIGNIGFGFLQWVDNTHPFLTLSLIIRIISAMGEAAFFTAVYPLTIEVRSFKNLFFTKLQSKLILFLFFR